MVNVEAEVLELERVATDAKSWQQALSVPDVECNVWLHVGKASLEYCGEAVLQG